jgi:DNA (cytosine-5)-methyltransferase 1
VKNRLTAVSLFSGCGGSDLGAKRAGVDVVLANDNNAYAAATYRKYRRLIASQEVDFRDCDIRDIHTFPSADLLLGCYPCQSFTMGGKRDPNSDDRTDLYQQFHRALKQIRPKYFVAENVAGLKWLQDGVFLDEQIDAFMKAGDGYRLSVKLLDAKDYGVPADRKRIFIVGVRKNLESWYQFPVPVYGPSSRGKRAYKAHGEILKALPLDASTETYTHRREPFSWWYLSRNRKRAWHHPAFTVVSNWRHVTLHPASPKMRLVRSDLRNRSRQAWEFTSEYDVPDSLPRLELPRRLSWRECAILQTFPSRFDPTGSVEAKYMQIGNAVPPLLMQWILRGLVTESALSDEQPTYGIGSRIRRRAA